MVTSRSTTRGSENDGCAGVFNYMAPGVESSLFRNGKVLMRRDRDGNDAGYEGLHRDKREVAVLDARSLAIGQRRTLATNGFELVDRPLESGGLDFFDQQRVVESYYPQCQRLVEECTGARAFAFDHNVRSAGGKKSRAKIAGGQDVQGPAHVVHGDYTLTSGPQRLRDLANPPGGNDTLRGVLGPDESLLPAEMVDRSLSDGGRFAIINVWRNIADEPVATHPIALCDGQTVDPEDLVVFEIHYQDRIGENYFAKFADEHRWYYYPEMTGREALLIKQWDSAGPLARSGGKRGDGGEEEAPCTFSFHSAFEDPGTRPDAPDRWSIEVRCIVVYP